MDAYPVRGKVKGVDMKKILAHIAASALIPLSLALVACGDEKTSNAIDLGVPVTSVVDTTKSAVNQESDNIDSDLDTNKVSQESDSISVEPDSVSQKTVLANSGPCSLNRTNGGDLAYLTNNENVGYQIIIPDVSAIGYYTDTELKAERIGDTLEVRHYSDTVAVLAWICYVYYTFNIPAEDADVKYLKYIDYVYKVVPGPAPEKAPDTSCVLIPSQYRAPEEGDNDSTFCIITTFSPSAEGVYDSTWTVFPYDIYQSSSSTAEATSSSSVINASTHHLITDANGQCEGMGLASAPLLDIDLNTVSIDTVDVRATKHPPVAYRYVGTERTGFTLESLPITCGLVLDTLDVNVSGDTVYVNAAFDRTNAMRCLCDFKIEFAVDNDPAYTQATVLVFDEAPGNDNNTPDIIEIVDMDVVPENP